MDIIGRIHFQNKVFVNKQECYGVVKADGNKFKILIAKCAGKNINIFVETIFHELLHLGCFVVIAITRAKISERQQHEMINRVMPEILQPKFLKILYGGKR